MRGVALALVIASGAGCNSLLGIEDLTLVDAPPDGEQTTYVVREGLNGYAMTQDTFITGLAPTATHGDDVDLQWTTTNNIHALLRFDDLFGTGGLPMNRVIQSATLSVFVLEPGSAATKVYESKVDWTEATTYNTFGPSPGVLPGEDRGTQVPEPLDVSAAGTATLNVTTNLQRFRMDPAMNKGWLVEPADTTLARIASSDDPDETHRPTLTVELAPE